MDNEDKSNKINILYILPKAQQGGAETQLLYLLNQLDRKKFHIQLGFLYKYREMAGEFKNVKDMKIIYFNKKNKLDISVYFKIARFIKENKIDIIHSFLGSHNAYLPAYLARRSIPIGGIMGIHDKEFSFIEKFEEFKLGRIFAKKGILRLVSCSYTGEKVYIRKGFPNSSIFTIQNGIDYNRFCRGNKEKILKEFDLDKKITLGMVGRLIDTKNHAELINAFRKLILYNDKLTLLIVGSGPLRKNLMELSERLDLTKRVIFTGNRKDIPDLLSAMDIFLFPSLTEGWPNAVGEAMAAGLPVIAFDVGDVKNIIMNGYDGYVVGRDIKKLMRVTERLIENPNKRKKIGMRAQQRIKKDFSVQKMVNDYEHFYNNLFRDRGA